MFKTEINNLTEFCKKYIITENDFLNKTNKILELDDSPIESFLFIINKEYPLESVKIGLEELETDNDLKINILQDLKIETLHKVQMFLKLKNTDKFTEEFLFENLFKAYWKENVSRKPISLLLPFKEANIEQTILSSLKQISTDSDCALVFADIDKFKLINDNYSMQAGDYLIKKISSIFEKKCINSIPIHRSGDEFIIIHPSTQKEEILLILTEINNALKDVTIMHNGEEHTLDISLSYGIYFIEKGKYNQSITLDDYMEKAEKSVKLADGSKDRGKIRIYHDEVKSLERISENKVKWSLIQSKTNILNKEPYLNVWLNFIVTYIKQKDNLTTDTMQQYFEEVINIISPIFSSSLISISNTSKTNYTHSLSIIDITIAFLNAIVLNRASKIKMKNIKIKFDVENHRIAIYCDNELIIKYPTRDETLLQDFSEITIPSFPNIDNNTKFINGKISTSLLMVIGNNQIELYDKLFNAIINVDSRPMTGGGLPDFWEAAIANLINNISRNANIQYIFVLGDIEKKTKISSLLERINSKDIKDEIYDIAYKTGYDTSVVDPIFTKLEQKIQFVQNEDELITQLFKKEFSDDNIYDILKINYSKKQHRKGYLKQEVNLEDFRLDTVDGCKGESLEKIYPVVINNIREIKLDLNIDFSNKKFKELTDYKIILTNPLEDCIPWFYENDRKSFDDYYKNNFIEEKGTFFKKLNNKNQVEAVISHISDHLKRSSNEEIINTRRAIIILDNEIKDEKLEPVGLVSIRIYHNLNRDGSISINFTYVWRTVEVIVGLPYSMYGSIQYSKFLLEKIIGKLNTEKNLKINIKNIKLGKLTYIAQSLHMFRDNYNEQIAKNIVNEATI